MIAFFVVAFFQYVYCVSVVPPVYTDRFVLIFFFFSQKTLLIDGKFPRRGSVQLFTAAVYNGLSDLNGLNTASFVGPPDNTFSVGAPSASHPGSWKPNTPNARLSLRFTIINRLVCVNQILLYENNGSFFVVLAHARCRDNVSPYVVRSFGCGPRFKSGRQQGCFFS